jgi:hypothetical protein
VEGKDALLAAIGDDTQRWLNLAQVHDDGQLDAALSTARLIYILGLATVGAGARLRRNHEKKKHPSFT